MPYRTLQEATPAIRGIYPPVSIRQANRITQWAADLSRRTDDRNPEAKAIALFKATYASNGSQWSQRNPHPMSEAAKPTKTTPKADKTAKGTGKANDTAATSAKAGKQADVAKNNDPRAAVSEAVITQNLLSKAGLDTFWQIANGLAVKAGAAKEAADKGLIMVTQQRTIRLTESGKALVQAASTGDVQAAVKALSARPAPTSTPAQAPAPAATQPKESAAPPQVIPNLAGAALATQMGPKPANVKERRMLPNLDPNTDLLLETGDQPAASEPLAESSDWYVPWGVTSFKDLQAAKQADDHAEAMKVLSYQYTRLIENVLGDTLIVDKITALETLHAEFITMCKNMTPQMAGNMDSDGMDMEESHLPALPSEPLSDGLMYLREVAHPTPTAFEVVTLAEDAAGTEGNTLSFLNAQIIVPGWGNGVDNHYYPAEVVKRDASKFVGAKMYESDHRPGEKSTRTWVSTIQEIVGFTEVGAPIARVAIHDPNFSERVKNLNAAGLIDKMECSILAGGKARPGFKQGGRAGRLVESIDQVVSVDWVTSAGAGGKALNLAESNGGNPMGNGESTTPITPAATVPAPQATQPVTPPAAAPAAPAAPATEPTIASESIAPVTPAAQPPARLPDDRVRVLLGESRLPVKAQERLAGRLYATEVELGEAITAERNYIAEVVGSGKPFGMGEATPASAQPSELLAEVNKERQAINDKYLGKFAGR